VFGIDNPTWFAIYSATGALIGALVTPFVFGLKRRKPATGFFAGVFLGALGNLISPAPPFDGGIIRRGSRL
jgi:hypothetical protein